MQTLSRLQMSRQRRRQRENDALQKRLEMQRLNGVGQDQEDLFIDALLSGKPIYVEQQSKRSIGKTFANEFCTTLT